MKISVIIPMYNSACYISDILDALYKQTYDNYEVILINDGSTDNTLEVVRKHEENNSKVKCFTIKNSGPGIARKTGFEKSTGDLLFFIDSDDMIFDCNVLKNIVEVYKDTNFDLLIFDFVSKYMNKEEITNAFAKPLLKEGVINENYLFSHKLGGALWEKIFVRSKMKSEYFYDSNSYEDFYTTYMYLNNCNKVYYSKIVCYASDRDVENSLSKQISEKKFFDTVDIINKMSKESKMKRAIMTIALEYFTYGRRYLDKNKLDRDKKKRIKNKINELKSIIKLPNVIFIDTHYKVKLKYFYFIIRDFIGW